jgi:hypothetical protein
MTTVRRIRRDERGSALVIALVFLSLFALFLTATLTSAEAGLHVAQSVRVQPKSLYGADGAIEQTIQAIRYRSVESGNNAGGEGDDCHTQTTLNTKPFYVDCTGEPGSGAAIGGGSSPVLGILTLATGAETGYQQGSNAIVRLDGGLYSNSGISFGGSQCPGNNCSQLNLCANNQRVAVGNITTQGSSRRFTRTSGATFVTGTQGDAGGAVRGTGIPAGSSIASVVDANTIVFSSSPANATGVSITFRDYPVYQGLCSPPSYTKGKLTALGACDTTRVVTVQTNCPLGVADPAVGSDPGYPPDATIFLPRTVPACGTGATVEFQPGKYTDVAALNALTGGSCNKLLHFNPGTYDFDFTGASSPVWTINNKDVTVSAGEATWQRIVTDGNISSGSTTITSASAKFTSADIGRYVNSGVNLPYGAQIVAVPNPQPSDTAVLSTPAAANGSGSRLVIGPVQSTCLESNSRKPVNFATVANQNLSLTGFPVIDGFTPQAGDRILVKDQTTAAQNGVYVVASGPWNRASDMDSPAEFKNSTVVVQNGSTNGGAVFVETNTVVTLGADPVAFVPGGDHPGAEFIFSGPSQLAVSAGRFEVCAPASGTNQQIGIYAVGSNGGLIQQTGCTILTLLQSGNCALITTSGNQSMMLIHGTIYAPASLLNLNLTNIGYQVVNRGIIARVVQLALTPSAVYTDPVIFSPDFGSVIPADRDVVLRACPGSSNCAAGTEKIRALVHFDDSDPSCNPDYCPGFGVRISSWRVLR